MSTPSLPNIGDLGNTAKRFALDVGERVVWSFVGATGAALVAAGPADMFHASFWQSVGVGGLAAAVSLVKGLIAKGIGSSDSASTIRGV